jgi:hypothetical protein
MTPAPRVARIPLRSMARRKARLELAAALLAVSSGAFVAAPAAAQSTNDRVAAEGLFSEGRQLMEAGNYEAACQRFDASRKLEPALGATLNLAACYEKLGRTASAWLEFKSAAAEARRVGDAERHAAALAHAAVLEPKLSRLSIRLADPAISVWRNGELLSAAVLTSAIPVDPGSHRIEARAPGKQPWTKTVQVGADGTSAEVHIPRLVELTSEPSPSSGSGNTQRTLAWVSGGVGLAGVGTGVVFALLSASTWSDAKSGCLDYPNDCTTEAVSQEERARTQATVATVASITGGVGLALGALLFLTDSSDSESVELMVGPTHVSARGTF